MPLCCACALVAAQEGHYESVQMLLEAGAKGAAENHWKENGYVIAEELEHEEVTEGLKEALGLRGAGSGSEDDDDAPAPAPARKGPRK